MSDYEKLTEALEDHIADELWVMPALNRARQLIEEVEKLERYARASDKEDARLREENKRLKEEKKPPTIDEEVMKTLQARLSAAEDAWDELERLYAAEVNKVMRAEAVVEAAKMGVTEPGWYEKWKKAEQRCDGLQARLSAAEAVVEAAKPWAGKSLALFDALARYEEGKA